MALIQKLGVLSTGGEGWYCGMRTNLPYMRWKTTTDIAWYRDTRSTVVEQVSYCYKRSPLYLYTYFFFFLYKAFEVEIINHEN